MANQEKRCGTCGRWKEGHTGVVGECSVEMEDTTSNHQCEINM